MIFLHSQHIALFFYYYLQFVSNFYQIGYKIGRSYNVNCVNKNKSMIRNISTKQRFADLIWNLFNDKYKLAKKSATKILYEESADA